MAQKNKRHAHFVVSFKLKLPFHHALANTGDLKDYIEEKLDEFKWVSTGELSELAVDNDHTRDLEEEFARAANDQ